MSRIRTATSMAGFPLMTVALMISAAGPAMAHTVDGGASGFVPGFLHPLSGFDHLLAMVSVGIWGAELGAPAIWLLPITFPLVMALGGVLGVIGVPLPGTELLIALSVLVLGSLVAWGRRVPLAAAMVVVAIFAIAHGHAHGVELPGSADAIGFTVGFVIATGLLHLVGIVIGLVSRWPIGVTAIRVCGVLVAFAGGYFLLVHAPA